MSQGDLPAIPAATDVVRRRSQVLATDGERERTAERLRGAYADGCFDHDELERRLSLALAARTRGDLARLTRDLPHDQGRMEAAGRAMLRWHAVTYLAVNGGLVATWAATGGVFWPAGSIGPWGAALAMHAYAQRRVSRARAARRVRRGR